MDGTLYLGEYEKQVLQALLESLQFPAAPTRDQLAAMAMQSLLTDRAFPINEPEERQRLAKRAHAMADAMLAHREKGAP